MSQTITLDAVGLKQGTDKASSYHDYLEFYEMFFSPMRNDNLTILEIGILNGASVRTWEEYFPNSRIVGADISPATKKFETERVTVEILDQSNIEELTRVAVKYGPFDIIIEDGSHMWEHQITSLRTLFPFVKNDGLYIVEDLQTNYGTMANKYKGIASSTCVDYLKSWVDLRVADGQIPIQTVEDAFLRTYGRAVRFITFYRRACLIKKRFSAVLRGAGQPLVSDHLDTPLVEVRIIAHVSNRGDVVGPAGFVNLGSDSFSLQGLAIATDENVLEYRVKSRDATWSDWSANNDFVGTRGQSKFLTGFTIRLRKTVKDRYVLRAFGRFVGSAEIIEVADEQDCTALYGQALCAIQVELAERVYEP